MKVNIAYSFDDNYAQHAGCSLISLLENNKDIEEIDIYIIDAKIGKENKTKIIHIANKYGRHIDFLDLWELTKEQDIEPRFPHCAYGRLFLAKLKHVDKILYFDSDTIIMGSIKELAELNMTNYLTAGVQDTVNPYYVYQIGLSDEDRYINDGGVIVLNLKKWREMNSMQACLNFIRKFNGNPPHNDQGTINAISKGYMKILPPCYNVMNSYFMFPVNRIIDLFKMKKFYSEEEINNAKNNPIVLHYTDELYNRPWFSNCNHPYKEEYRKILRTSPWEENYKYKKPTKNCRIQNFIYDNFPYAVYKLMIRFIELKHRLREKGF